MQKSHKNLFAVSVPSNVAEGAARKTKKDALQFFYYA